MPAVARRIGATRPAAVVPALLGIVLLGGFLRSYGLASVPMLGDELEDIEILGRDAQGLVPFMTPLASQDVAWDQARLPFLLTRVIVWLTGLPALEASRALSIVFALLVLIAIFALGHELFDARVGLLATALQAASIYDIGFSRLALTSSSSLFVTWFLISLLCFYRAARSHALMWYSAAGMAIGISMAAKFFGLFTPLIVAVSLMLAPSVERRTGWSPVPADPTVRYLLGANVACLTMFAVLAVTRPPEFIGLALYLAVAVTTVLGHWQLLHRASHLAGETRSALLALVGSFAVVYFFIFSPAHLDIHRLAGALKWFSVWHEAPHARTAPWDFVPVLLIRLNVPWNILWLAALAHSWARRRQATHRLLLLSFAIPFAILSVSRWKVTWYLMAVFPICYLIIAALVNDWLPRLRRFYRPAVVAVGFSALLWYGWQLINLCPHYQIDGYRLGRAHIGWSRAAFVTFERLPDIVDWLERNVPGEEVACLLIRHPVYNNYAYRHVERVRHGDRVHFRLVHSVQEASASRFVVTSFYADEYREELIRSGYHPVKVFWLKQLLYATVLERATSMPPSRSTPS